MSAKRSQRDLPTTEPSLVVLPDITVAYVSTDTGEDPSLVGADVMKALYGAAYGLRFALKKRGVDMVMDMPRARWEWRPDEAGAIDPATPTSGALSGQWALSVPDGTLEQDLPQKDPRFPVRIARWQYGDCAWVMHLGGYDEEMPTVRRLVSFIHDSGREVIGDHEEWYLSMPNAKVPKTVILYPVRERSAAADPAAGQPAG